MFDMLSQPLAVGDIVAVPIGSEMKIGRITSLGKKMVVLEQISGHPKSISGYRGGKRYFEDVIKVDI